jgi:hypothetical protein
MMVLPDSTSTTFACSVAAAAIDGRHDSAERIRRLRKKGVVVILGMAGKPEADSIASTD